ncbi:MAG: ferredoxin [Bryobacterales bacterium]
MITVRTAEPWDPPALPRPMRRALRQAAVYDPKRGESWANKFSLVGNPESEETWVTAGWQTVAEGREIAMQAALTPADARRARPVTWRTRFLLIPPEAWSDEQVELSDYLDRYVDSPPQDVPFIWAAEEGGRLGRAVVSRGTANACRNLRRAWRTYQELAGVHNGYVESALETERARSTQRSDLETARMVDEAKRTGAAEAIRRLVTALANPKGASAAVRNGASAEPAPPAPAPTVEVKTKPEQPPAVAAAPEGPYIDSALCTSCNECINLNPRMFQYNENKQAYIADPKAGPYKTLLKAAAACPAQCIHAGPPPN